MDQTISDERCIWGGVDSRPEDRRPNRGRTGLRPFISVSEVVTGEDTVGYCYSAPTIVPAAFLVLAGDHRPRRDSVQRG